MRAVAVVSAFLCVSVSSASELPQIVLLGDSITAGVVSGPSGPSFREILSDDLEGEAAVVNIACGGASSRDWSPTIGTVLCGAIIEPASLFEVRALPSLPARLVTVLLGTNDAVGFFEPAPISPETYGDNLAELSDALLDAGAEEVMLIPPPPSVGANQEIAGRLEDYRSQIESFCEEPGLICGPDLLTLLGPEHFEGVDVHPNAAGHALIAMELEAAIVELLPEPAGAGWAAITVLWLCRVRSSKEQRARHAEVDQDSGHVDECRNEWSG